MDEWNAWRALRKKELGEERLQRLEGKADDREEIEVWIDEVIEQIEEVIVE